MLDEALSLNHVLAAGTAAGEQPAGEQLAPAAAAPRPRPCVRGARHRAPQHRRQPLQQHAAAV